MTQKEDRVKLFANELNYIHDPKIREFAKRLIEGAPEYFFHAPASSSGKYHPPFDLGEGGLVRHTRCVAYFANCFGISHMADQRSIDMLVTCAIAHDIKKQGEGEFGQHTVTEHPTLAANYILDMGGAMPDVFTDKELAIMYNAVQSHMGQWGAKDGLPVPKTTFDFMLHDADYVASRKEILDFAFAPTEDVKIVPEPINENVSDDPGKYVLNFGKHAGKTLEEIEPTGYLDWMLKQEDFKNVEAQEAAKKYLEWKKNPTKKAPPIPTASPIDDLPF